jgi:hypothetical protein
MTVNLATVVGNSDTEPQTRGPLSGVGLPAVPGCPRMAAKKQSKTQQSNIRSNGPKTRGGFRSTSYGGRKTKQIVFIHSISRWIQEVWRKKSEMELRKTSCFEP